MGEMIERVTLAIYNRATKFDGDEIGVHLGNSMMIDGSATNAVELRRIVMSVCEDAALAAIEAMREPTEDMETAGWSAIPDDQDDWSPVSAYERMIDAALSRSTSKEEGNG